MGSPLKRRRTQDDLGEPPRKFCKFDPFELHAYQPYPSLSAIHTSSSFHDDFLDSLPTVTDDINLSKTGLLSPTADKENVDPAPLDRHHSTTARCQQRKPFQEYTDIEGDIDNGDSDSNTGRECWVTRDGELYTIVTGPLARSSGHEWKTLKQFPFKDVGFIDSGILGPTSCDLETLTSAPPPREEGPAVVVSRPPPDQFQPLTGDQKALGIIQKRFENLRMWSIEQRGTNLNWIGEQSVSFKPACKTGACFRIKPCYMRNEKPEFIGRNWPSLEYGLG